MVIETPKTLVVKNNACL